MLKNVNKQLAKAPCAVGVRERKLARVKEERGWNGGSDHVARRNWAQRSLELAELNAFHADACRERSITVFKGDAGCEVAIDSTRGRPAS